MYSSFYSNSWWEYDEYNSKQLEIYYNDYNKRKSIMNGEVPYYVVEPNTVQPSSTLKCTFEEIDYNDMPHEKNNQKDVQYTIYIGNIKYIVDLENWKQINCCDNKRTRKIKRIEIPNDNIMSPLQYLKNNYNYRGIAGTPV